jgi:hypothetical protein
MNPRFARLAGSQLATRRFGVAVAAAALALACAPVETVRQRSYPKLEEGVPPINKVAVAPLGTGGDLAQAARRAEIEASITVGSAPRETGVTPAEATALVARYLSEALYDRGIDVTTQEDFGRALTESGTGVPAAPREAARLANERFGAQAVLLGNVLRYKERTGGAQESGAASVWFEVALYTAPQGEKLWAGVFNETQRPLSGNVLSASRYPGGGTRWLSVDELAKWGATETAASMPVGSTTAAKPRP